MYAQPGTKLSKSLLEHHRNSNAIDDSASSEATIGNTVHEPFHALAWFNSKHCNKPGEERVADHDKIRKDLDSIDLFLCEQTSREDCAAYRDCPMISKAELHRFLEDKVEQRRVKAEKAVDIEDEDNNYYSEVSQLDYAIHIFNSFETLFEFFLPLAYEGGTVRKYWGGINRLMQVGCLA